MLTKKLSLANMQGKLNRTEMKSILAGYRQQTRCYLEGKASCSSPSGIAYGGWETCNGDFNTCYNDGKNACSQDACCASYCCELAA